MLSFGGMTLIERQIRTFRACGISDIIIVRGYAAEKIVYDGVTYFTNDDYENTNMVESLLCARREFDCDMIVSYSDIIYTQDMLAKMIACTSDFAVAVDDDWRRYWQMRYGRADFDTESLSLDDEDCITELGLPDPKIDDIDARYIGLLKFSRAGLECINDIMSAAHEMDPDAPWQQSGKTVKKAYMTDLLNAIVESGRKVRAVRFQGGWIEFDTNEDLERAREWAASGELVKLGISIGGSS